MRNGRASADLSGTGEWSPILKRSIGRSRRHKKSGGSPSGPAGARWFMCRGDNEVVSCYDAATGGLINT